MGRQRGREWISEPGDIDLLDTMQAAEFGMDAECRSFMMFIPQCRLRPQLSDPDLALGMRVLRQETAGAMASACLRSLLHQHELRRPIPGAAIDSFLGLLALAVGATADATRQAVTSFREAKRQAVRAYVERNLADPSLSPAKVAAASRVSTRYLHGLFAEVGESLMSWVWSRRLGRCREALANPAMSARTITDIAGGWGFQCLSHFCRTFKAAHGMPPNEWRRAALLAQDQG
jgi:AraC-like DNA-binding protein